MEQSRDERFVKALLLISASSSIFIVFLIFIFLFKDALPFFKEAGLSDLVGDRWIPVSFQKEQYGLLPLVAGSLNVALWGAVFSVPLGFVAAVYIGALASPRERELLKPFIEILAGVPSVVLGFFGVLFVVPLVKEIFGLSSGLTALSGGMVLGLMALPTIVSISEDAIRAVPKSYIDASLALGASRMETVWFVVVPAAFSGIVAAIMLGLGRVIGETMAVLMVTGNAAVVSLSPLESVRTMTATIAAEMGEVAVGTAHYHALFVVGVLLLAGTFVLNMAAQRALRKVRRA